MLNTCSNCKDLPLTDWFSGPDEFLRDVELIKELIIDKFECIWGDPYNVMNGGAWVDDGISIIIKCKKCGRKFECYASTYHGWGDFLERK